VLGGKGEQEDRFFQIPFRGLDQILKGVKYDSHPADAILYDYISGAVGVEGVELHISQPDEISWWLEGKRRWTRSALSLHILSCERCRERVESIRAKGRPKVAKRVPPWEAFIESIPVILLRRSTAIALILLLLAAIIILLYPSKPPVPIPIYFEDKIGQLKGVG